MTLECASEMMRRMYVFWLPYFGWRGCDKLHASPLAFIPIRHPPPQLRCWDAPAAAQWGRWRSAWATAALTSKSLSSRVQETSNYFSLSPQFVSTTIDSKSPLQKPLGNKTPETPRNEKGYTYNDEKTRLSDWIKVVGEFYPCRW